jgi:hypothetical protein
VRGTRNLTGMMKIPSKLTGGWLPYSIVELEDVTASDIVVDGSATVF